MRGIIDLRSPFTVLPTTNRDESEDSPSSVKVAIRASGVPTNLDPFESIDLLKDFMPLRRARLA